MTGQPDKAARQAVLRAFWHRTRKVWVPLTKGDVAHRIGASAEEALSLLMGLQSDGLVVRTSRNAGSVEAVYALTDKGKGAFVAKGAQA